MSPSSSTPESIPVPLVTRCASVCRMCAKRDVAAGLAPLVVPFDTPDDRTTWETVHRKDYGHENYYNSKGWPSPDLAMEEMSLEDSGEAHGAG